MKKCIFIGQAMPRYKSHPHDWPSLNSWLDEIGVTHRQIEKYFFYSALVDYFPGSKNGSHMIPTVQEIEAERGRLIRDIRSFDPEIFVPVGMLSITYCLGVKGKPLKSMVGNLYVADPYGVVGSGKIVIPLPHPSGASTWYNKQENKLLLDKALRLLKSNL